MEDRQMPEQPLVLSGDRTTGRKLNLRLLSELPHQLIQLHDWEQLEHLVATLPFIEAKFESGKGYECLSELLSASKV